MQKVTNISELKVNQIVYYIPHHLQAIPENAERGRVSIIRGKYVWVRYTSGDTGARTPIDMLYT